MVPDGVVPRHDGGILSGATGDECLLELERLGLAMVLVRAFTMDRFLQKGPDRRR